MLVYADENEKVHIILTLLLPKFITRQLRYADLPANDVTFPGIVGSKYGSVHLLGTNALIGLSVTSLISLAESGSFSSNPPLELPVSTR